MFAKKTAFTASSFSKSLSPCRGGIVGLLASGELWLWGCGRSHGFTGHSARRRGQDPHPDQAVALEHDRRRSLHLHGSFSPHPGVLLFKFFFKCHEMVLIFSLCAAFRNTAWAVFSAAPSPGLCDAPWWPPWPGLSTSSWWLEWASNLEEQQGSVRRRPKVFRRLKAAQRLSRDCDRLWWEETWKAAPPHLSACLLSFCAFFF